MASLALTTQNPAVQGAQDMQQLQANRMAQGMARLRYDEARRTADAERAVDDALREMILGEGGLGRTGGDVGGSAPDQTQPGGMSGEGDLQTFSASPMQTASGIKGSIAQVPTAPGPQATASRGDVPGFQAMLAGVQQGGQMQQVPNAAPGATPGQPTQLPNATPAMQPQMVQLQDPGLPGTIQGPRAARTHGLDRAQLAQRLARVPGGGRAAYEVLKEQEAIDTGADTQAREDHQHAVDNFFESIKADDATSARYWAQQAGMNVGEDAYSNADVMNALKIAGKYKAFYGQDTEGFGRFMDQAFKGLNAGDPNAFQSAFSANRPRRIPGAGRIVSPENQVFASLVQKHGGDTVAAYQEYKAMGVKGGSGRGPTTIERREELAQRFFPNDPQAQAAFINGARPVTRFEIRKAAIDEMNSRYGSYKPSKEDYDRELAEITKELESVAFAPAIPADDGQHAQADPTGEGMGDVASQMRVPTAENNIATYQLDGVDIYTNDGTTWYNDAGELVYGGPGN